jgi:RimJ/RimL family protein N-acetyltransferase
LDRLSTAVWRDRVPMMAGKLVSVREVALGDAQPLYEVLARDPRVNHHISPPPPSVGAFQGFVNWSHRERARGQAVCFAVVPHGSDEAVGIFQVRALEPSFFTAEWGFAIGSAFWSTGVFEDAANLVAAFAFTTIKAHRLEGRAASANGRGNGALQKIGASGEGLLRRSFQREGNYHNQFLWALIASEWRHPSIGTRARFSPMELEARIRCAIARCDVSRAQTPVRVETDMYPFFITDMRNALPSALPVA